MMKGICVIVFFLTAFCKSSEVNETISDSSIERSCQENADCVANNAEEKLRVKVQQALTNGQKWLLSEANDDGWGLETARVITTLALTSTPHFFGQNVQNKIYAKELELQIALAIARKQQNHFPLFINALLSTCKDPRDFYGFDLVAKLEETEDFDSNYAEALTYLSLCNAGVVLDHFRHRQLVRFTRDFQLPDTAAMSTLALSCSMDHGESHRYLGRFIKKTVKQLKMRQNKSDGSFGNVFSSALVLQAFNAVKADNVGWNSSLAKEYILSEQNPDGSMYNLLAGYFAFPALAGKSLADIRGANCSSETALSVNNANHTESINETKAVGPSLILTNASSIVIEIFVNIGNESTAKTVFARTNSSLYEILNREFHCVWKDTSFGPQLISLNGLEQDTVNRKYWAILQNWVTPAQKEREEYLSTGASFFYPKNGTRIVLKYESF